MEIFNIVTLSLSGLLLFFVGLMRLSNPVKTFAKSSGIQLPNDTDLLNEVRGLSAVMLLGGVLILLGILVPKLTFTSHCIACLILLGFAIGRIASIVADGKPNKQITQGIIFELIFGAANIFCLINLI